MDEATDGDESCDAAEEVRIDGVCMHITLNTSFYFDAVRCLEFECFYLRQLKSGTVWFYGHICEATERLPLPFNLRCVTPTLCSQASFTPSSISLQRP